ncbi:2-aminoethylphosphonate--pyruvate transaminase [Aeoliella mucimassa]|uniref:2-aminoethylphosphonate--pyruvate transaminase n=1 Tax=Aeoliella mucimassa TaxID=2527972 RepID=A0A518AVE6_9BACT|nr:2-aminoethylphosphonate--pyruvate transaminase [Aeoliella mucimassa]QDU58682.1 2-aminoethylphosphonate--pyruvate transaminase [Aeoliella mucimassa]
MDAWADNDYLLLTPGPLSTSPTVRAAMDRDWCTWDDDYNVGIVTPIRERLVEIATAEHRDQYSAVLMQGSGTFAVESMLGTLIPEEGKLLVLANGAYGDRLAKIASYLKINHLVHNSGELAPPDLEQLEQALQADSDITHVALIHNETTTGMLNPLDDVCRIVKQYNKVMLLDSMSAFGGIPFDVGELGIDCVVSSSNKCIQGVPGFGFVICRIDLLQQCKGRARSLSMDVYDQWITMEQGNGKWRFTSPTHVVRAFHQALQELEAEGGVPARYARYCGNQQALVKGMENLGFRSLLPHDLHSPIITGFLDPESADYNFREFYALLKSKGFVIYPGKVTNINSFRIGTIGHVFPSDIERLIDAVESSMYWQQTLTTT